MEIRLESGDLEGNILMKAGMMIYTHVAEAVYSLVRIYSLKHIQFVGGQGELG